MGSLLIEFAGFTDRTSLPPALPAVGELDDSPPPVPGNQAYIYEVETGAKYRDTREYSSWAQMLDGETGDARPGVTRSVIGSDDKTRVQDTTQYPHRAVVALTGETGQTEPEDEPIFLPNATTCAGVLVGPRHVLTAAHCVFNAEQDALRRVRVEPARDGNNINTPGVLPYGSARPFLYYIPQRYADSGDRRYDYALLVLDCDVDLDCEQGDCWMPFGIGTTQLLSTAPNVISGYEPNAIPNCDDGPIPNSRSCQGHQYTQSCPSEGSNVRLNYIDHECDFGTIIGGLGIGGPSGSPHYVLRPGGPADNPLVIGNLVAQQLDGEYNISRRIRQGSFDSICEWIHDNPVQGIDHPCF